MDGLLSEGIAEVQTVGTQKVIMSENVSLYEKLRVSEKLPISIRIYNKRLPKTSFMLTSERDSDWIPSGGLKIFVDGAFGARTAALREPFADANHRGILIQSDDKLYELIKERFERDLQIMTHCLGDRALDVLIDQIERVKAEGIETTHQ
jgi:predicted amidohydrolase YtcJ